jgi:hypothetical protein
MALAISAVSRVLPLQPVPDLGSEFYLAPKVIPAMISRVRRENTG